MIRQGSSERMCPKKRGVRCRGDYMGADYMGVVGLFNGGGAAQAVWKEQAGRNAGRKAQGTQEGNATEADQT